MVRGIHHDWKLPPRPDPDDGWLPIVRVGWIVPFGYEEDPDNPLILNPIPEKLDLLEKAKQYVKKYSYPEVAEWLSYYAGETITSDGLRKRIQREAKQNQKVVGHEYWAEKYKEASRLAKEIQKNRVGRRRDDSRDPSPDNSQSS